MTDLRVPERYLMDRRIARLQPADFCSFVMASLWSVSNRTDGALEPEDLPLVPMFNKASIPALVERGLWNEVADGWVIADYAKDQTSKHDLEVLENARRADREKKARQRAQAKAEKQPSFSDGPRDTPREISPGGHRTGQAREGEGYEEATVDERTGEVTDIAVPSWPVAAIPQSKSCRVCGTYLEPDFPLTVCPKQDTQHAAARSSA